MNHYLEFETAVRDNDSNDVIRLLKLMGYENYMDDFSYSLSEAIENKNHIIAEIIIHAMESEKYDQVKDYQIPLETSIHIGDSTMVKLLLDLMESPNYDGTKDYEYALRLAEEESTPEIVGLIQMKLSV